MEHGFSSHGNFVACHVDPGGSFRFIFSLPLPLNGHGHRTQENKALSDMCMYNDYDVYNDCNDSSHDQKIILISIIMFNTLPTYD